MLVVSASFCAGGEGTTAVNFLRIGTGAKASGMGEAQVAVTDSVDSVYWNPAGLALVNSIEISLMHLIYWEGISSEYAACAFPIPKFGVIGVGFNYLSSGLINKTIETPGDFDITGDFSYAAFAGTLSYGNKFMFNRMPLYLGASVKMVGDRIEEDSAIGAVIDAGAILELNKSSYLGLLVNNIGITYSMSLPMPMQIKLGAGLSTSFETNHFLLGAVDVVYPLDSSLKFNAGVEYSFQKTFFLRVGYKINYPLENLTAGAGFRLLIDKTQYELNYSFTPGLNDVGTSHRISLLIRMEQGKGIDTGETEGALTPAPRIQLTKYDVNREKVAEKLLSVKGSNDKANYNVTISDAVRSAFKDACAFEIFEGAKIDELLKAKKMQLFGCTTKECAVEAGKVLGVDYVIIGTVKNPDKKMEMSLKIIDSETGKAFLADRKFESEDVMAEGLQKIVAQISAMKKFQEKKRSIAILDLQDITK